MNYKYMRIQGREDSYVTKYPKGVFSLCWNLIRDGVLKEQEKELFISIDEWFKENLPEPEPCKNHEMVITFFKCESTEEMLLNKAMLDREIEEMKKKADAAKEEGGDEESEGGDDLGF